MTPRAILLWVVVPYLASRFFALGHAWRYRYDKFGWTTRSASSTRAGCCAGGARCSTSGSSLVFVGHVMALGIPERWTTAIGISDAQYHARPPRSARWPGSALWSAPRC